MNEGGGCVSRGYELNQGPVQVFSLYLNKLANRKHLVLPQLVPLFSVCPSGLFWI